MEVETLELSKATLELKVGTIDYIGIKYSPSDADYNPIFDYDETKIDVSSKNDGLVITALSEGMTELTVSCGKCSSTCIITITGFEIGFEKNVEPYIYSNTSILQLSPGLSEKVFVSLYGGSVNDINDYTWSVDDNSICRVDPVGQYGLIKAVAPGYTRVKITHSKSTYPYYMGVYVFDDPTKVTYITTNDNVLTMNLEDNEQTINVSLVNPLETSIESGFNWEIVEKEDCPIKLSYNGAKAVITPLKGGSCTVRVTHPDSAYPLDILCRVITIVKNVYIEPDKTIITLSGDKEETLTSQLMNIDVSEYSLSEFNYSFTNEEVASITANVGNQIYLKGLKNGSTKLIISHPKSAYTREVLLISTNQITDALDVSCYITTSDNYVRTKIGAEQSVVNISLKGGVPGDENDFVWDIKSSASDGSNDSVIQLETSTGSVKGRMAQSTYVYGNAYITPKKEGTAVITITHPKVLYPTEILIKVLSKDTILEQPLYLKGDGIVRVLNGETYEYTVVLNGDNYVSTDNQNIKWEIDDNRIKLSANENKAVIKAPFLGTGTTISHIDISHPKVDYPKSVLVLTADDEQTLMSLKALYSDKNYYNFEVGTSLHLMVNSVGFDDDYDYSLMNWQVDTPNIIDFETDSDARCCSITGLNSGTVKLTASIENCSFTYTITVYPKGAVQTEPEIYFTTTENVVVFNDIDSSRTVNVTAVNMQPNIYSQITWKVEDESICTIKPNGTKATVTSLKEGETVISVSHPQSENTLKIYIKVGSEYIIQDYKVMYISATDVITMLKDDEPQKLQAVLVNYEGSDSDHFSFTIDNSKVAKISAQSPNGIAFVAPVGSGEAEITITNLATEITKKVLVVVGNSAEELAGYTYLTTPNNVVSIGEGTNKTVSVSVKNSTDVILDGYTWSSSNYNVADVIGNGSTASIKANSIGTAMITVTNKYCKYSLQIIVHVVDPIQAAANPYIQLSSSVLVIDADESYFSLSADLVGGNSSDYSSFIWTTNDSSICSVYGQNEIGKIKGLKEGTTYITVSHPKAQYSAQLLVVVENPVKSDCYISVPSSIINIKPTDSSQTITATLINGDVNDKYNFTWSLDVYDIIDFQYSANVCTILPKQTGTTTITVSHPKADYDQQIIVTVQEYNEFNFPSSNITITQGDVKFLNMQVPITSIKTHVEYFVKNEKICSCSGTNSVAQITGVGKGSTTITAKLVASNTGAEQASADLLVYVKEKVTTEAYITSSSTIYTVAKDKSQALSATLTGTNVTVSDQANLKWTTSDSDIISITGIGSNGYVKGQSIYITAKKAGEAIITCSHDKASSVLEFFIVVPGADKKIITFNKSYLTLTKGSGGSTLEATIENAESNDDYNRLDWSCVGANGKDGSSVAKIMGTGKSILIYPVSPGQVTINAQLPDTDSVAKCTVIVEAGKSFVLETSGVKVAPGETKTINYKVSPPEAIITWTKTSSEIADDIISYKDLGCDNDGNGKLQISGLNEGTTMLMASTDGGATGKLTIQCCWSYDFQILGNKTFNIDPNKTFSVDYTVLPANAEISVQSADLNSYIKVDIKSNGTIQSGTNTLGKGTITITPIMEKSDEIKITVNATNKSNKALIGQQNLNGYIQYSQKLTAKVVNPQKITGVWSTFENNTLRLGDGETYSLSFEIAESKSNATITEVMFNNQSGDTSVSYTLSNNKKTINISYPETQGASQNYYKISNVYIDPNYPNYREFTWCVNQRESGLFNKYHYDFFRLLYPSQSYKVTIENTNVSNYNIHYYNCYGFYTDDDECYDDDDNYVGIFNISKKGAGKDNSGQSITIYEKGGIENLQEIVEFRNTTMEIDEFENIAWFYCPGTVKSDGGNFSYKNEDINPNKYELGEYGTGAKIYVTPHIMSSHVIAEKVTEICKDTTVKSSKQLGYISVKIEHNGKTETASINIPVILDVRDCLCTYKGK